MFKIGDVVVLRSGGLQMVVVGIDEPHLDYVMPEPRECVCEWLEHERLRAGSFPCEALEQALCEPNVPSAAFSLTDSGNFKRRFLGPEPTESRKQAMANVFIEPRPKGQAEGATINGFVVEDYGGDVLAIFNTQQEAVAWAKNQGYHPLVALARHLNEKAKPDHWRSA